MVTRPGLGRIQAAFAEGRFGFDHAWRCADTMANLPEETSHHTRRKAEQDLVRNASKFDPADTARIGRHLLHVLDPDLADRKLQEQLEKEEKRARRDRVLWFRDAGHGKVQFGGWLDTASANTLRTALEPLTNPNRKQNSTSDSSTSGGTGNGTGAGREGANAAKQVADSPDSQGNGPQSQDSGDANVDERRSRGQRLADALVDLAQQALTAGTLPQHGGEPTQVVTTIRLSDLIDGINAAYLPTGDAISATQARIMACDARVIPAVLDSAGVPLDIGRGKRLFDGKLRKALELRDGGCVFPGCHAPAAWCDGHHIRSWHDGGATSLDNAALLCRHHHRLVHTEGWQIRLGSDRHPELIPPRWVDPDQRPMRNLRPATAATGTTDSHLADAA